MRTRFAPSITRGILAVVALLAAATPARAQLTRRTLPYQGSTRTWFEHLPAGYDGSRPVALVVALHGFNNSGDQFAATTGWETVADAGGFIVVFPNGGLIVDGNFGWNNFVFDGGAPDDVGFLLTLINQLEADYRVDPNRVFMNGFSNGSGITSNFAGVHGSVLAGIGLVSGGWLTGFGVPLSNMQPGGPLPVWVWGNNPGDDFQNGSETMAQQEQDQLQWWIGYDGNGTTPATAVASPYTTRIYPGGQAEVRYTEYLSGGHAFQPGTAQMLWTDFFSGLSKNITHTPPPTFAAWQSQHFTTAQISDPSVSGYAANPSGDGLCNLLKYAFGLDPGTPGAGGRPAAQFVKTGGSTYLALRFRRANAATDLTYSVETSSNPATGAWTTGGVAVGAASDNGDGTSTVVYRDTTAMGAGGRRLMRLRVTRQP